MTFAKKLSVGAGLVAASTAVLFGVGGGVAQASTSAPNVSASSTTKAKTTCVQQAVNIRITTGIDGIWGSQTTANVKSYQGLFGFTKDGIVGKTTGSAMLNDIKVFDQRRGTHYYGNCYALLPSNS